MLTRRKFLASAVAVAVAPTVAPELASFGFDMGAGDSVSAIAMWGGPTIGDAMRREANRMQNALMRAMLDNAHLAANPPLIQPADGGPTIKMIPPRFDPHEVYFFENFPIIAASGDVLNEIANMPPPAFVKGYPV